MPKVQNLIFYGLKWFHLMSKGGSKKGSSTWYFRNAPRSPRLWVFFCLVFTDLFSNSLVLIVCKIKNIGSASFGPSFGQWWSDKKVISNLRH